MGVKCSGKKNYLTLEWPLTSCVKTLTKVNEIGISDSRVAGPLC